MAFKSSLMAGVLSMIGACIDCLLSHQVQGHRQYLSLAITVDEAELCLQGGGYVAAVAIAEAHVKISSDIVTQELSATLRTGRVTMCRVGTTTA